MNRREALRLLATGAMVPLAPRNLLAALREARAVVGAEPAPRTLNTHQDATVKAMAEMILPRTDTPGAADVGASEFIDLILTEWYDEQERSRFLGGLADVDARTQALFAKDFLECSQIQQADLLTALGEQMIEEAGDQSRQHRESLQQTQNNFYSMLRRLTLTAYYTSEAGASEELHFQIIPDRHAGCVEVPVRASGAEPENQ